jgi:1-acyl-sn-glycerol-3-phosphate acyltransferase
MRYILRFLVRTLFTLITRTEILGLENIPATGSFVIASNHLGLVDAVLVFYALDRWDLFTMVAEKWGVNPLTRWLGKHFNFIFIDRFNPDIQAMRQIMRLMRQGLVMVIAPEGTRSRVGSLIEGKPGVSYLAAKAGYPIVPVGIAGSSDEILLNNLKHLHRTPIHVRIGEQFRLPPLPHDHRDQALQQFTDEIMCRIAALLPERYRGVYAGHPRLKELLAT